MHEFTRTGVDTYEKKVNQDTYFCFTNFCSKYNQTFLGVCDGHGPEGHLVSGYLREILPSTLNKSFKENNLEDIDNNNKESMKKVIINAFNIVNNKINANQNFDNEFSGSTCVSALLTQTRIITCNTGDSRCIIGKFKDGKWTSEALTRDHKPSENDEKMRILNSNGFISPSYDEETQEYYGPDRVWVIEKISPGLAMTRSFGDSYAHSVGVTEEPEIKEYIFKEEDKMLILGSDGLFDYIDNDGIINIAKNYYISDGDTSSCCEKLYEIKKKLFIENDDRVDDITMIIIFFE